MNKMHTNSKWLMQMAREEGNDVLSVGGLAQSVADAETVVPISTRMAFARLVQLFRRDRGLSIEQLAANADVDIVDVVNIERGADIAHEPRTIYKIAELFKVPVGTLMQLAGLAKPR